MDKKLDVDAEKEKENLLEANKYVERTLKDNKPRLIGFSFLVLFLLFCILAMTLFTQFQVFFLNRELHKHLSKEIDQKVDQIVASRLLEIENSRTTTPTTTTISKTTPTTTTTTTTSTKTTTTTTTTTTIPSTTPIIEFMETKEIEKAKINSKESSNFKDAINSVYSGAKGFLKDTYKKLKSSAYKPESSLNILFPLFVVIFFNSSFLKNLFL